MPKILILSVAILAAASFSASTAHATYGAGAIIVDRSSWSVWADLGGLLRID
jgi:hypothetical protein